MLRKISIALGVGVAATLVLAGLLVGGEGAASEWKPSFDGPDADRPRVIVTLRRVAQGFRQPTDVQFPPGRSDVMVVLEKAGAAHLVRLSDGASSRWFEIQVRTASEEGLLGLAFHPRFAETGRFYLNFVAAGESGDVTRVEEWSVEPGAALGSSRPTSRRRLLEVAQPYANHNAGQVAFGPDGKLYVGLGDGGAGGDPHGHGQNTASLLGKMLRLDVDGPDLVPTDNPFVGRPGFRPEIWAYGLRNPWRYTFSADGRLVVADVGQNRFEEITVVGRGENHGWAKREASHCFPPGAPCTADGFVDPVYEYGRDDGVSVTGGVFSGGQSIPALAGRYVFGDFASGRLWALDLPPGTRRVETPHALGRWPISPSTFGRDAAGEVYVADFAEGTIFRLASAAP